MKKILEIITGWLKQVSTIVSTLKDITGAVKYVILIVSAILFLFQAKVILKAGGEMAKLALRPFTGAYDQLKSDYEKLTAENSDFKQKYVQLDSIHAIAQSLSTKKQVELDHWKTLALDNIDANEEMDKRLRDSDSLVNAFKGRGFNMTGESVGSGKDSVTGSLTIDLDSLKKYGETGAQDDWLTVEANTTNGHKLGLDYEFECEVFDVTTTYSDEADNQITTYTVGLRSLRNPSLVQYIEGYKMNAVNLKPGVELFTFWNPRLSVDLYPFMNDGLHGGFSFSVCTIQVGAKQKDLLLELPQIGIATNLHGSTYIPVGLRFNVAHFLPLLQDLQVTGNYGFGTKDNIIMIGIGTGL